MENYLKDGRCSISNNAAERAVKSYVMGRKNFLFHGTVKGATASAIVYTLAETAKVNAIKMKLTECITDYDIFLKIWDSLKRQ